jgi:hypothetical protein
MTDESGTDGVESEDRSDQRTALDPNAKPGVLAEAVHSELRGTEELPVEREARRWIGEAQAVAADAASAGLAEEVVRERLNRVSELLAHVDEAGHEEADERVRRARRLAGDIEDSS